MTQPNQAAHATRAPFGLDSLAPSFTLHAARLCHGLIRLAHKLTLRAGVYVARFPAAPLPVHSIRAVAHLVLVG